MNEFSSSEIENILYQSISNTNQIITTNNNSSFLNVSRVNRYKTIKKMKSILTSNLNESKNYLNVFYLSVYYFDVIDSKREINLKSESNRDLLAKCCINLSLKFIGNYDEKLNAISHAIIKTNLHIYNPFEIKCLKILNYELCYNTSYDLLILLLNLYKDKDESINKKLLKHCTYLLFEFVEHKLYPNYSPIIIAISIIKYSLKYLGLYNSNISKCTRLYNDDNRIEEVINLLSCKPKEIEIVMNNNDGKIDNLNNFNRNSPSTNSSSPGSPVIDSNNTTNNKHNKIETSNCVCFTESNSKNNNSISVVNKINSNNLNININSNTRLRNKNLISKVRFSSNIQSFISDKIPEENNNEAKNENEANSSLEKCKLSNAKSTKNIQFRSIKTSSQVHHKIKPLNLGNNKYSNNEINQTVLGNESITNRPIMRKKQTLKSQLNIDEYLNKNYGDDYNDLCNDEHYNNNTVKNGKNISAKTYRCSKYESNNINNEFNCNKYNEVKTESNAVKNNVSKKDEENDFHKNKNYFGLQKGKIAKNFLNINSLNNKISLDLNQMSNVSLKKLEIISLGMMKK